MLRRRARSRALYEIEDAESFLKGERAPDASVPADEPGHRNGTDAGDAVPATAAARRPLVRIGVLGALVVALAATAVALRGGSETPERRPSAPETRPARARPVVARQSHLDGAPARTRGANPRRHRSG